MAECCIEAFACGLPVIGSDSGEIPYVLKDAGIVVGEKDQIGWIKAITDLLNSPSHRQELGKKSFRKGSYCLCLANHCSTAL